MCEFIPIRVGFHPSIFFHLIVSGNAVGKVHQTWKEEIWWSRDAQACNASRLKPYM
jgi:hypothetical protein